MGKSKASKRETIKNQILARIGELNMQRATISAEAVQCANRITNMSLPLDEDAEKKYEKKLGELRKVLDELDSLGEKWKKLNDKH